MRRSRLGRLAGLAALCACSRNLDLPESLPPRVDGVFSPGREQGPPVAGGFPALAGELVAIRGSGLGSDPARVQVTFGAAGAEVVTAAPERLVARVPPLPALGETTVTVSTGAGPGSLASGLRYEGPGAPPFAASASFATTVSLVQAAAVEIPPALSPLSLDPTLGSLAVAIGAGDSALVVAPGLGAAFASVPLGIVPVSVAARFVPLAGFQAATGLGPVQLQILGVDRLGAVGIGGVDFALTRPWSGAGTVPSSHAGYPVVAEGLFPTGGCEEQRVIFTRGGSRAVVAWRDAGLVHRIAALDEAQLDPARPGTPPPLPTAAQKGAAFATGGAVVSWAALDAARVGFASNGVLGGSPALSAFDASAPASPAPLFGAQQAAVLQGVASACGIAAADVAAYTALAVSADGKRVAAAFSVAADLPRLAEVDGTLAVPAYACGLPGPAPSALAYATPDLALAPAIFAATLSNLQRFARGASGELHADAALQVGANPLSVLPAFGGVVPVSPGGVWRLLVVTPDGDLVTVLPSSMTSLGPVYRLAPYGAVSVALAEVDGSASPVAIAEHTLVFTTSGSLLDTAGAAFVLPLSGGSAVSLGGGAYGRGSAWLARAGQGAALAFAADPPDAISPPPDGLALFVRDACEGGARVAVSRRFTLGAPELLAQGPARAGLLGPSGVARYGPSSPPVYVVSGTRVDAIAVDDAGFACLLGGDWSLCPRQAVADLGFRPLDLVFSAGDAALAARRLDTTRCLLDCQGSSLCERAFCAVAAELAVARPGTAPVVVPLPSAPVSVAPDRAGGFVVSLACEPAAVSGCFTQGTLCSGAPFRAASGAGAGALVLVPEDGGAPQCLAVRSGLAGTVAIAPNGAEAWVAAAPPGTSTLALTRLLLPRSPSDGSIDRSAPLPFLGRQTLGRAAAVPAGFAASGVAFAPDGSVGAATVPGEFRILLFE